MSLLLIAVFYSNNIKAQNAEKLFNNYHKWGVTGQYNIFPAADITPTNNANLDYKILKDKLFSFGFTYNFYQKKRWNFKARLQLQWFGNTEDLFISKEETVLPINLSLNTRSTRDLILYFPITTEYVFFKKGNINIALGGGLALSYYGFSDLVISKLGVDDIPIFISNYINSTNPFYTSGHIEASVYFKRKKIMFQTSIIYNKSFKSYRTGKYEFKNLDASPVTRGYIDQSGDYIGVSLTVYFKKKNKS